MNKIEELEKQLNEEISKIQVNLKEKHKWIVGKYVKYNDSLIARIDDIHHIPMLSKNGYTNYLKSDDFIFVNGTVVRYSVNRIKDIIDMPDEEFENLVERLFSEAKKNLL